MKAKYCGTLNKCMDSVFEMGDNKCNEKSIQYPKDNHSSRVA